MVFNTEIKKIDDVIKGSNRLDILLKNSTIKAGASLLKAGEVVAIPTETVYGLAADATRVSSVQKIFAAKGRPQDNPLIVHIAEKAGLTRIMTGELSRAGCKLIESFWPGPLTIIVNKSSLIPETTTGGLDSVAVRMPLHPVARALIKVSGLPLAAPSANLSGLPSPTRAEHVAADLGGKIPLIIDGGSCQVGVESTVVDVRGDSVVLLRPGGISREMLEDTLGVAVSSPPENDAEDKPLSPGMKYRHYAPSTPLYLINRDKLRGFKDKTEKLDRQKIGLLITEEAKQLIKKLPFTEVKVMGSLQDYRQIAANLFNYLRELDDRNLDYILVEKIPAVGIGEAIMNRLNKAAVQKFSEDNL